MEAQPVGLIAGQGELPIIEARGMRAAGRRVVCVGLHGNYDPALPGECDLFRPVGLIQLGRWIRHLRRWGASEAVMVGRVRKTRMYDPLTIFRQLPDWRAARIWYGTLRHDKRNDALLTAVADELQRGGVTLIDTTQYIPEHLASAGVMTRTAPSAEQLADIEFALPIVRRMGDLDIGQALAVKERDIIAVEAIEGTDAMIRRAGELCRAGKWTLLKLAKPKQDMRFDVPTVGVPTIANLQAARATCLAVEADKVIMVNKPAVIQAADEAGIAIVGIRL